VWSSTGVVCWFEARATNSAGSRVQSVVTTKPSPSSSDVNDGELTAAERQARQIYREQTYYMSPRTANSQQHNGQITHAPERGRANTGARSHGYEQDRPRYLEVTPDAYQRTVGGSSYAGHQKRPQQGAITNEEENDEVHHGPVLAGLLSGHQRPLSPDVFQGGDTGEEDTAVVVS
jgi:hypothetical protein